MTATPQTRIGPWVVLGTLGTGGMATVFRAHAANDPSRIVAVKVCDHWHPEAKVRFGREVELLRKLDHRGVVRVLDADANAQPPYLVMELVKGEDLCALLRRVGPMPIAGVLRVGGALAEVMSYLHSRAVYHRDLKPANVIVQQDHSIKLVDFGIARVEGPGQLTMPGSRMGTVGYSPPEWVRPHEMLPQQWDLYGLGALLDEMLTGIERFPKPEGMGGLEHAVAVMAKKNSQPDLDPGPMIPAPLRELVRHLTRKVASERPQTAREVHHRLVELARDPTVVGSMGAAPGTLSDYDTDDSWIASVDARPVPIQSQPEAPTELGPEPAPLTKDGGTWGLVAIVAFTTVAVLGVLAVLGGFGVLAAAAGAWFSI